jgi:VanZ family protein
MSVRFRDHGLADHAGSTRRRTWLPHVFAFLYGLAIAYASLQPFAPWMAPAADAPFWLLTRGPLRWTRYDILINVIAYLPFGLFVSLLPRRASPLSRASLALLAGLALSFAMETLQAFLPPRDATLVDLTANTAGAFIGGFFGASLVRAHGLRRFLSAARHQVFLDGTLGDIGVALLALWLVAQINPGIALFSVHFEPDATVTAVSTTAPDANGPDHARLLVESAETALQLVGVGLFVALLLRDRRFIGGAVLLLVGAALLAKGITAMLVLKPAAWEAWLKPGVTLGLAAGLLVLLFTVFLPRPVQVAACATAALASLLLPLLGAGVPSPRTPLSLFDWRYGQLLNFNGLTQSVLMLWPLAVAAWLFALAGRPAWGAPR